MMLLHSTNKSELRHLSEQSKPSVSIIVLLRLGRASLATSSLRSIRNVSFKFDAPHYWTASRPFSLFTPHSFDKSTLFCSAYHDVLLVFRVVYGTEYDKTNESRKTGTAYVRTGNVPGTGTRRKFRLPILNDLCYW